MKPRTLGIISGLVVLLAILWLNVRPSPWIRFGRFGWPLVFLECEFFKGLVIVKHFSLQRLILDASFSVAIIGAVIWKVSKFVAHRKIKITVSVKHLFVAFSAVTFVLFFLWRIEHYEVNNDLPRASRYNIDGYFLPDLAKPIVMIALFSAFLALFDFIGWLWSKSKVEAAEGESSSDN